MTPIIITTKNNGLPTMINERKQFLFATTALAAALLVNVAQAADVQEGIVEKGAAEYGLSRKARLTQTSRETTIASMTAAAGRRCAARCMTIAA